MKNDELVYITTHSQKRFRERTGLPKRLATPKAQKALENGLTVDDVSGKFRRYLEDLANNAHNANRAIVYNGMVYLFRGTILVTVIHLPQEYKAAESRAKRRKNRT